MLYLLRLSVFFCLYMLIDITIPISEISFIINILENIFFYMKSINNFLKQEWLHFYNYLDLNSHFQYLISIQV